MVARPPLTFTPRLPCTLGQKPKTTSYQILLVLNSLSQKLEITILLTKKMLRNRIFMAYVSDHCASFGTAKKTSYFWRRGDLHVALQDRAQISDQRFIASEKSILHSHMGPTKSVIKSLMLVVEQFCKEHFFIIFQF